MKYRIVEKSGKGFKAQYKHSWWPFWFSCVYTREVVYSRYDFIVRTSHWFPSYDEAKNCIDDIKKIHAESITPKKVYEL
jgi:hypothetical protein